MSGGQQKCPPKESDRDCRCILLLTLELTPGFTLVWEGTDRMPQKWQIGVVARETGLTVDAIRFYEKCGLLQRPARTEGGYRLFRPDDVHDLKFIRKAQDLGFSLQEIRELLFLQGESIEVCDHVRELLNQKLETVRGKIAELRELERGLEDSLRKCDRRLRRSGAAHADPCPVLNGLGARVRIGRVES